MFSVMNLKDSNAIDNELNSATLETIGLLIDSLGTGGAQRQIVNLAIGLKRKGLRPIIIFYSNTNYFAELLESEKIVVRYLKRRHFLDVFFLFNLIKLLMKEGISKLVAFLFMPSGYALLTKVVLPTLQVIVSERSFEAKTKTRDKIFPRKLYFLSDFITANSQSQTLHLERLFPRFKRKIVYVPNGVYKQEYIYSTGRGVLTLTSIGRVSELKDTKILIEAINNLRAGYPSIKFKVYWVGALFDANPDDSAYFQECNNLIFEYGLEEIWEWTGQVSDVKAILFKSDLLVHMSHGEGFPNAICEAMSYGIPVVASNLMDHPYIVQSNKNGYLVDMGDLNGLVKAISSFIELKQEEKLEMSKSAFTTAQNSFSLEKMTSTYHELLLK